MNSIVLKGRLTKTPELRYSTNGLSVCRFSIAVERKGKKDEVDYFDCKAFGKTADFISGYFNKGKEILLRGSMQSYNYDKDGENRRGWGVIVDEVEFCGSKGDSTGQNQYQQNNNQQNQNQTNNQTNNQNRYSAQQNQNPADSQNRSPGPEDFVDDDIPF